MLQFQANATAYFLPDDAAPAQVQLLADAASAAEKWIICYGLNWLPLVEALCASQRAGHAVHVYADRSSAKQTWEQRPLAMLADAGVDLTIGTSTTSTGCICHTKGLVVVPTEPGQSASCWEGSTNFTAAAWKEVNTALQFNSDAWATAFRTQFAKLAAYAWSREKTYQLWPARRLHAA
jgi:hypothetical protein